MTAGTGRPVSVVVDSTSDIPDGITSSRGIVTVPLTVTFGDQSFTDGVDLTAAEFLSRLKSSETTPTTSQPPVTAFADAFSQEIERGHDVFCMTIAAELSGTFNAARLAAETVDASRVRLLDSRTVSIHLGLGALAAARAAAAGDGLDAVESVAVDTIARSQIFVVLETLEYLRRGGRIGKAQALVGSVLSLKPVLTIREGHVMPLERVRTWRKALDRMIELVREQGPLEGLAIYHVGNELDANAMADRLSDLVPLDTILIGEIGSVVSTYAGPGALGLVPLRRKS
jgi:DegV family protein with EDD domain